MTDLCIYCHNEVNYDEADDQVQCLACRQWMKVIYFDKEHKKLETAKQAGNKTGRSLKREQTTNRIKPGNEDDKPLPFMIESVRNAAPAKQARRKRKTRIRGIRHKNRRRHRRAEEDHQHDGKGGEDRYVPVPVTVRLPGRNR